MKVLLDENLPVDLRHFLAGHQTFTVPALLDAIKTIAPKTFVRLA